MSHVNIVRKRAWPILSDGINKYLFLLCGLLWPQFGNLTVTLCIMGGHTGVEIRSQDIRASTPGIHYTAIIPTLF
jgi:hypothetical protein